MEAATVSSSAFFVVAPLSILRRRLFANVFSLGAQEKTMCCHLSGNNAAISLSHPFKRGLVREGGEEYELSTEATKFTRVMHNPK